MLDNFFIYGPTPAHIETGVYTPFLVWLSYVVASLGSYTGLTLAASMKDAANRRIKDLMLACGAFALGSGVWSMHFIGMLAFKMRMAVSYDPLLTAISMVIAIILACGVLMIAHSQKLSIGRVAIGAVILGIAISAMHYTGMAAMKMDANLRYTPWLFFLSVAIAIIASAAALGIIYLLGHQEGKRLYIWRTVAALIMGAAICGMHYTGMAAANFIPFADCRYDPKQNFDAMALAVAAVTSIILGIAIIVTVVVKGRETIAIKKEYPFPIKLLVLASAMTLFSVIWASGNSFYIYHRMTFDIHQDIEISQMGNQIVYTDTVISNALQRLVTTGDPKWVDTYKDNVQRLNEIVDKLKTATHDQDLSKEKHAWDIFHLAQRIDKNTDFFLKALEEQVLELAPAGKLSEAQALLNGQEYTSRRQDYVNDVHKLADEANDILEQTLASLGRIVALTLYSGFIVIIILPLTWFLCFRSIRQWREELENTRMALLANEKQLQQSIWEIETSQGEAMRAREAAEQEAKTVALLRSVAATANEVSNINEAIEIVLGIMCGYLKCPIGHANIVDAKDNLLRPTNLWFLQDQVAFKEFVEVSSRTTFKRGEGLPGKAWEGLVPIWYADFTQYSNLPRMKVCSELNIRAGLAFPLIVKNDAAYVLEFFFQNVTQSNEVFLPLLQEIGNQLVRVIERSNAEETMKLAKESAEKANASKSEFLANMSHELRTPLNSILGMLRLLKDARMTKEELSSVDTAYHSSINLLEIVNDILDLSKIEAGEMKLERIGMDPYYMINSVILTLDHLAREKQIELINNVEKEESLYVLGDPTRFTRIMTNLLSNAIKYTDHGHVDIRASYKKRGDRNIEFRCEITDTGIGIPKEKLQIVFEKFVQADTSTTRRYGGTGLGLAITKQLVELMNGTIGVESTVDVGSTFWFSIPFEVTDTLNKEKETRRRKMLEGTILPPQARILVAEDHPMNQLYITKLLQRFGIGSFTIAENGLEAIKRYQEASWDVILMDCHIPEKNGYDTSRDIRELERKTNKHTPIVAMTANAMVGDKEKCLSYGMDEYISKPVSIEELKAVLGQWICFEDLADIGKDGSTLRDEFILDLSFLKSFSEGDLETERQFVTIFIAQSDKNLKTLSEYQNSGTSKSWREAAHLFKGGASGMGAAALSELCNEAQHFEGTSEEQALLFKKIDREYTRVREHLKKIGLLT